MKHASLLPWFRWASVAGVAALGVYTLTLAASASSSSAAPADGLASPRPLGVYTPNSQQPPSCPFGLTCHGFTISACPGVSASADGFIAVGAATGSPRGLAVFFSGGYGTGWWGAGSDLVQPWLGDIRASGLETVLVEWKDSWLVSSPGEKAGVAALACRPSTAVKWVHDHLYVPLGIPPGPGECGFCITGNSGGSSQVSYALSFYGEDRILNADFPTSGPPHGAINKGCIRGAPNPQRYWYTTWAQGVMDSSYGFHEDPIHGPCYLQDPAYVDTWKADSVAKGGNDYSHPSTRVGFIIGGKDGSVAPAHARDYYNKLVKVGGSLAVNWTVVPEMPHSITNSPEGLAELRAELLATG